MTKRWKIGEQPGQQGQRKKKKTKVSKKVSNDAVKSMNIKLGF